MKKAVIVFHSVCANTYLMAKTFETALQNHDISVSLYRVEDKNWKPQPDTPERTLTHFKAMTALPLALPEVLLTADIIIMGAPTYFGNVSAQMKAFQDATSSFWFEAKLAGKIFTAFTSAGSPENGAGLCLQTMHFYAHHMGMITLSVPNNLWPTAGLCPYGIVHHSKARYGEELDERTLVSIDRFVEYASNHV